MNKCLHLLAAIAGCLFFTACFNNKPKEDKSAFQSQNTLTAIPYNGIVTIDLTKKYPKKDFTIDDTNREFILLETTNEILADKDFKIQFVSDKRIIATNSSRGDVFIFGRDGKVISHFNQMGNSGMEYLTILSIVFDEDKEEIFVVDNLQKNRCLVFSEDGKFIRQFNFPSNSYIDQLYNFDDQTLLAYNRYRHKGTDEINQRMPYVLLSKKDGSVVSRLDISFDKRNSERHAIRVEGGAIPISITYKNIIKCGQEFIISDISSDTVFVLKQDKKLTPLFERTPSVSFAENFISLSVSFKTEQYLFFEAISYNWNELEAQWRKKQELPPLPVNYFAYDLHTGQIFSTDHSPTFSKDSPICISIDMYHVEHLVEHLEKGELQGELKQIAKKIKGEDINPIVIITKYK